MLLSAAAAVLVLPEAEAALAAELCGLGGRGGRGGVGSRAVPLVGAVRAIPPGFGTASEGQRRLSKVAASLVALAAEECCPSLAACALPAATAAQGGGAAALRALDAACPPGTTLLRLVLASPDPDPLLRALAEWAAGWGDAARWDLRAEAATHGGLTALHAAAALGKALSVEGAGLLLGELT